MHVLSSPASPGLEKGFKLNKITVGTAYGINTLQQAQIYRIMKLVKEGKEVKNERGHGTTKRIRVAAIVAAAMEEGGFYCATAGLVKALERFIAKLREKRP